MMDRSKPLKWSSIMDAEMSDLTIIAQLLDDLKHDEVPIRVNSTSQLPKIASALGSDRTRDELIPFLVESTDDEDEVLTVMAEQLGSMVLHVGGPSYAHFLLPPLLRLAVVEEASVRDRAVLSLTSVVAHMAPDAIKHHWHPALLELCKHDYFTARISACALCGCGLAAVAAAAASSSVSSSSPEAAAAAAKTAAMEAQQQRVEVRHAFAALCQDDTPMVRRVAFFCLGALATLLSILPQDRSDADSAVVAAAEAASAATAAATAATLSSSSSSSSSSRGRVTSETASSEAATAAAAASAVAVEAAAKLTTTREVRAVRVGPELLGLFSGQMMEDQDSVRLQSVSTCAALAKLFSVPRPQAAAAVAGGSRGVWLVDGLAAAAAAEAVEGGATSTSASHVDQGGGGGGDMGQGQGQQEGEGGLSLADEALGKVFSGFVRRTCGDASWRVRWSAVVLFHEVAAALGPSPQIVRAFEALLKDPEAEVRTAAAANVSQVLSALMQVQTTAPCLSKGDGDEGNGGGQETTAAAAAAAAFECGFGNEEEGAMVLEVLLPAVRVVAEDPSEHVRAALAGSVTQLAPVLGRDNTISKLLPLLLQLLRDTNSEVRLNVVRSLGELHRVIGVDLLAQSLLPTILDLARDGQWRVRLAILDRMPSLATQLGVDFFSERLVGQCVAWLVDDVYRIREAAAASLLKQLTDTLGSAWAVAVLLPHLVDMTHQGEVGSGRVASSASASASDSDPNSRDSGFAPMVEEDGSSEQPSSSSSSSTSLMVSPSAAPGGEGALRHPSTHRLMAIKALESLSESLGGGTSSPSSSSLPSEDHVAAAASRRSELVAAHVVPVLLPLCVQDPVPNVRFNAAKALARVAPLLLSAPAGGSSSSGNGSNAVVSSVRAALTGLSQSDADVDVRFFATQALAGLGGA